MVDPLEKSRTSGGLLLFEDSCTTIAPMETTRWLSLRRIFLFALFASCMNCAVVAQVILRVQIDPALNIKDPLTGRLLITMVDSSNPDTKELDPADAPFWAHRTPGIAMEVVKADPTKPIEVVEARASFLNIAGLRDLKGSYKAVARLIRSRTSSQWNDADGNLYGEAVMVAIAPGSPSTVELHLTQVTKARTWPSVSPEGVEEVSVRSQLLSDFHKRDVFLKAGVVLPRNFDAAKKYAAVYEVPGFGGRHFSALRRAKSWREEEPKGEDAGPALALTKAAFWIVLDPESPNGHTLFADSANNGPCGEALVKELIPAIEAKYPALARTPGARLLRGHSSGGWSTIWLQINHPDVFGATWSTAPDPIDFRRMQLADIYAQSSIYVMMSKDPSFRFLFGGGREPVRLTDRGVVRLEIGDVIEAISLGSYRSEGKLIMTAEQENLNEEFLGPDNTSGQQWDSWFAVFGPRSPRSTPEALFDPKTGIINKAVAEQYKKYDITQRLRAAPTSIGPVFRERIRLVVGMQDNFYLEEAVQMFKWDLDRSYRLKNTTEEHGYIYFIPKTDHGSVLESPPVKAFPKQMIEHLIRTGFVEIPRETPIPSLPPSQAIPPSP